MCIILLTHKLRIIHIKTCFSGWVKTPNLIIIGSMKRIKLPKFENLSITSISSCCNFVCAIHASLRVHSYCVQQKPDVIHIQCCILTVRFWINNTQISSARIEDIKAWHRGFTQNNSKWNHQHNLGSSKQMLPWFKIVYYSLQISNSIETDLLG